MFWLFALFFLHIIQIPSLSQKIMIASFFIEVLIIYPSDKLSQAVTRLRVKQGLETVECFTSLLASALVQLKTMT